MSGNAHYYGVKPEKKGDKMSEEKKTEEKKEQEKPEIEYSRVKALVVSPNAFLSIMVTGNKMHIKEGVPKDAKIVGADYEAERGIYYLFLEHESFELSASNEPIPTLKVEVEPLE